MPENKAPKKPRGMPISLPQWWFEQMSKETAGYTATHIAKIVNALADARGAAWDRSTVSKFLKNQFPTLELTAAFCEAFNLTMPVFITQTHAEAIEMLKIQREHARARRHAESKSESTPEKDARNAELDKVREALEKDMEGQTKALDSRDEGTKVRGRYRSVGRSRPTS